MKKDKDSFERNYHPIPLSEIKQTGSTKKGLVEVQLKDPNTCENYKEVGCVKDICDCYTLVKKGEKMYSEKEVEELLLILKQQEKDVYELISNRIKQLYDNEYTTGFTKRAYSVCLDIINEFKNK